LIVDAAGSVEGGTGSTQLDRQIAAAAKPEVERGQPRRLTVGDYEVFVDVQVPAQRLIIVGAVHVAVALCDFASKAGFSVVVVDPRPQLNSRDRFPSAHALQIGWPEDELPALLPDESTYIAVLTHDEKFDDPSLTLALRTRAKYIGAIGSKKTQALRRERLIAAGFRSADVDRVHAPIGLDLGAQSPEEIAIAILAEMIATKFGHRGSPLKELQAAQIH
jgi:xanthine dehydrogenase accessory factor